MVRVEFTVEPFVDGQPGDHVIAAWQAVAAHGASLDNGPFSSETTIPAVSVPEVVADLVRAALSHGATRVSFQVERIDP